LVEEFFYIFHEKISAEKIQKTLALFHIEKLQKQNIHSLSG
jgi:energy-coupling factor transporter ATP-binding protein EcfA2